jgi:hypothetical protein
MIVARLVNMSRFANELATPAPATPKAGSPSLPKIRLHAATALKIVAIAMTRKLQTGLLSAARKALNTI